MPGACTPQLTYPIHPPPVAIKDPPPSSAAAASADAAAAAPTDDGHHVGADDAVVAVAWADHRGALAVLWASGTLAIFENPRVVGAWDVVSWFKTSRSPPPPPASASPGASGGTEGTKAEAESKKKQAAASLGGGPAIPVAAAVTLRWSYHSLLLAVGASVEVFAFHDHLEVRMTTQIMPKGNPPSSCLIG